MHASQVWGLTSPRPPATFWGGSTLLPKPPFGGRVRGERGDGEGDLPRTTRPHVAGCSGAAAPEPLARGNGLRTKAGEGGGGGGGSLPGVEAQQKHHTRRLHFFWGHLAAGRLCRQAQPRRLSLSSHMCAWDLLGLYMDSYIFLGLQEPPRPRNIME